MNTLIKLPLRPLSTVRSYMNTRTLSLVILAIVLLSVGFTAAAQDTTSLAGQQCPPSVHDQFTTIGPDGNVYPTWSPTVDPATGCWMDHEHGSDPRQFVGFSWSGMPAFGYMDAKAGTSEPHEGFKVYVTNNDLHGHAWMIVIHQGSRGVRRALVQYHTVDWYVADLQGNKLAEIHMLADFGYASPNCSGPGNETPGQFFSIPNSATGYEFSGYQVQRRFIPTVDCATTRVYETWTPLVNVGNIFMATATFDIDNPSTVVDPNNPGVTHTMCEYRSPNETCGPSWYTTQWAGNKRNVVAPQYEINNTGNVEFYTDPYGKLLPDGSAPNAVKQYVTNNGWSLRPCYCNDDSFRPQNTGLYVPNTDPLGPNAMLNGFPFGPKAAGQPLPTPLPTTPAPNTPVPTTPAPGTPVPTTPAPGTPVPTTPAPVTPVPTDPSVIVNVNPAQANVGETVNVTIGVANVSSLYGLQTQCAVDPNVLAGTSRSDGDVFNTSNSFFVDTGFQSNGSWLVAASRLQPNPAYTGNGAAYTLSYTVQSAGSTAVTCTALAVDQNGTQLPVTVINGNFSSNGSPVPTEPTVVPPTEVSPEPTEVTAEPTVETPVPPNDGTPTGGTTIKGTVAFQNHANNAGIKVDLVTPDTAIVATITTNADGSFSFIGVKPGNYGVTATAPQHLRIGKLVQVTTDGQIIDLGAMTLPAGDSDDNGTVDIIDASLVGANFNVAVPPAPTAADFNADGTVDIRDLVLVGSNFGLTAPIILQ